MSKPDDIQSFNVPVNVNPGGSCDVPILPVGVTGYLISADFFAVTAMGSAAGDITLALRSGAGGGTLLTDQPSIDGDVAQALTPVPGVLFSGMTVDVDSTNVDATAGLACRVTGTYRRTH